MAEFSLLKVFGNLLYSTFQTLPHECTVDCIVPIPLHIRRLRERGFNQALLLARTLSKRTRIPCRERTLRKIKDTPFQTVLKGRERRRNLKGAFHVDNKMDIKGNSILLVDDVYTTGTTVNECARTLLKEGADKVAIVTLARAI